MRATVERVEPSTASHRRQNVLPARLLVVCAVDTRPESRPADGYDPRAVTRPVGREPEVCDQVPLAVIGAGVTAAYEDVDPARCSKLELALSEQPIGARKPLLPALERADVTDAVAHGENRAWSETWDNPFKRAAERRRAVVRRFEVLDRRPGRDASDRFDV